MIDGRVGRAEGLLVISVDVAVAHVERDERLGTRVGELRAGTVGACAAARREAIDGCRRRMKGREEHRRGGGRLAGGIVGVGTSLLRGLPSAHLSVREGLAPLPVRAKPQLVAICDGKGFENARLSSRAFAAMKARAEQDGTGCKPA